MSYFSPMKGHSHRRKPAGKILGYQALEHTMSGDTGPWLRKPTGVFLRLLGDAREGALHNSLNLCDGKVLEAVVQ